MLDLTLVILLLLKQNIGNKKKKKKKKKKTFFAHNSMQCYLRLFNFGLLLNLFDVTQASDKTF